MKLSNVPGATFDDDGLPDQDRAGASLVFEAFPARHRPAYTERFYRDVLVVAVKVANDLADPHGGPASCTAEEILRSHIGEEALALCELAGLDPPGLHPDEILLEDTDFESLYDDAMDGVEDDPAHQARIGLEVAPVAECFPVSQRAPRPSVCPDGTFPRRRAARSSATACQTSVGRIRGHRLDPR